MAASSVPPAGVEENSEPLKYKTWVLKVLIHCEGCKRKVKRILRSVEGVYTIDVDTKQHKVIVTGNVESNTLLRKLEKSGKHAELWPNKNNCSHPEEQQPLQQQQPPPNEDDEQNQNVESTPQNVPVDQQPHQHQQNMVKEVRFEGNPNPPGNDLSGDGGSGAKKKKKKKKSNSGSSASNNNSAVNNNNEVNNNNGGPPLIELPPPEQQQLPQQQQQYMGPGPGWSSGQGMYSNPGPGSNRVHEYPPSYHAAPAPVCGMSYNTAYPRRHTSSYYSTQQPYSYAYACVHQGGEVEMSIQPAETLEIFSDENPNACSVM